MAAIMLVLSLIGLGATPAQAEPQSSLLLLGISSSGRVRPDIDNGVQLRLSGLGLAVVRPKQIHVPPCESTECLSQASATESTDLVLAGRVQKNEHACIATLWLLVEKDKPPVQQDIVCLPDGTESDLAELIANNAGELVESHLRGHEPATDLSRLCLLPKVSDEVAIPAETKKRWSWKKKMVVAGLGVLLAAGIASTIISSLIQAGYPNQDHPSAVNVSNPGLVVSGSVSGAVAACLLFVSIKQVP